MFQSLGVLEQAATGGSYLTTYQGGSGFSLYDDQFHDYAGLWRSQPNVRLVTEFLARNMAQLGIHVFDRVSDNDRERLSDHPLAKAIRRPNPYMTRYRLVEHLMMSLGIYHEAFWLKVRPTGLPVMFMPISPGIVVDRYGGLWPEGYRIQLRNRQFIVPAEDMVHFRCHNPASPLGGISPLLTLRRILAEEQADSQYRQDFWQRGARIGQVIQRPAEAPDWSDEAVERFRGQITDLYTSSRAGGVAVLEDGMTLVKGVFSPDETEFIASRKLAREEVARAYHIPPPMVGILENATLANVKEYHAHLYQDTLGPWCVMIEEDIELQVLPEFDPNPATTVYVEFNIAEKLKGTPEDQMSALVAAAGGPILLRDEARGRLNLNALPDGQGEQIITPLNVIEGAFPVGTAGSGAPAALPKALQPGEGKAATVAALRARHQVAWRNIVKSHFDRQARAVLPLLDAKAPAVVEIQDVLAEADWQASLQRDFEGMNWETARTFGGLLALRAGLTWTPDLMRSWLRKNAEHASGAISNATANLVAAAMAGGVVDQDRIRDIFGGLSASRSQQIATRQTTAIVNFGEHDAAKQGGLSAKTWQVTSQNPRESHAAIDGETVAMEDVFGNGLRFPGDPNGSADETAGCSCRLTYGAGGA